MRGRRRPDRAPVGLTVAPANDRVYVTNRGTGTVSVLGVADGAEWGRNAGAATVTVLEDLVTARPMPRVPERKHSLVGRRLPPFSLVDVQTGERRSRHHWDDRQYVLNFFASW